MSDSILSITIRDTVHPCAPYQNTGDKFRVQIFHCDGKPLFWRGINYGNPFPLDEVIGEKGGGIHAQVKVPRGCYVVRAFGNCNNFVTDWAWVQVCCDETVCVDLVLPSIFHCTTRMIAALQRGSVVLASGESVPVSQILPREVQEAVEVLTRITDGLPRGPQLPAPPTGEDLKEGA